MEYEDLWEGWKRKRGREVEEVFFLYSWYEKNNSVEIAVLLRSVLGRPAIITDGMQECLAIPDFML